MALILLQVLVLGVTAAAVDDGGVTWSQGGTGATPCAVANWTRISYRRPPPPLDDDQLRVKPVHRRREDGITPKRSSLDGTLDVMRRYNGSGEELQQCTVQYHCGMVLGYPVSLKLSYMDEQLKSPPQDEKTRSSQPLAVPCVLDPQYTAIDGNRLPGNDRYFSVQSELLNSEIKTEDELIYRCNTTKPKRHKVLARYDSRMEDFYKEDNHEDSGEAKKSEVKKSGLLTCPLNGWPRINLTWELTAGVDDTLVLPKLEDQGVYTCTAVGDLKRVKVVDPVRIIHAPTSKQARRASTVRFNCTASGNPEPHVSWYKDGRPLASEERINVRTSADGLRQELVIGGLTISDQGVYQCFAYGPGGFASGWAQLNVTGPGASPPVAVKCAPVNAHSVELRWRSAAEAYTLSIKPKGFTDKPGPNDGQPFVVLTNVTVSKLEKPLTPYQFQVRAYLKYGASDLSHSVVCQGQGVPIKLFKSGDDKVLVSWKSFAEQTPGVVEWKLQYRAQNDHKSPEHTIPLSADIHNYTLSVTPSEPLLVRLLGSRTTDWLPQNLTLVPWTSTARAGESMDDGLLEATVEDVAATLVRPRSVSLSWRCERCPARHSYRVCARAPHHPDVCRDSVRPNADIDGLSPDTEYELRVQVRTVGRSSGPFSNPYPVRTLSDGPQRFKDLTYKFVNESGLLVSWSGAASNYTVRHSAQLVLPVEYWAAINVVGNSVLINGIQPSQQTFVMVTGYGPLAHSPILTVPPPRDIDSPEAKDYAYEYTSSGVQVSWAAGGARLVRYSQNITRPLEHWFVANASGGSVQLDGLDPSRSLYVQVSGVGQVLTIPPRPPTSNLYLSLGLGCSIAVLCAIAVASAYIWRRRRMLPKPGRSRRGHGASAPEEEGSEMKTVGARLCNGAGEPLLNGHVHITENPASKTPNGRMKRGRRLESQFEAFDLSRNDADTTQETTLGDSYALDATRPGPTKVPDDNMNVEPGFRDNSQVQPTLQPNG